MALDLNYDPNWKPQGDSGPDLTYDPNWAPPKAPEGGLIASLKQATGNLVKGAGQAAADYLPGVSQDNALKSYGQEVIDANPTAVRSLSDIATSPWTATKEAVGNAVGSMGAMVGANVAGRGLEAVAPFTGPARPIVSLLGKGLQVAGPVVAAGLPSYGGIREAQIQEDPTRADDAGAKARALAGAGAVGLIERSFGPEQLALKALTKEGRAKVIESMAGKSLAGSIGKGMAKGAAVEGAEELAQNPIEQFASYQDPTTAENIEETLFGGAMGALGGGVLGGAGGGASYMARPEQPKVDPTAGPLSRAAATAQETGAAGLAQAAAGEGMAADAQAATDPITARLAGVASFAEDKEFLRALRNDGRFGAESVTELLGAYATARNPNADPTVRENALNAIEQFTGAFVGPSTFGGQQNFTMQGEPDTFVREPREQTGVVPFQSGALAQPGADPFDPNTLDGQAREVGTLPRQMLAGPEDAATQYRRELLESVLSDPETKNPLPRYESLLKKNGFEQRRATPEERKLIEDRTVSQAETARAELPPFAAVDRAIMDSGITPNNPQRPAFPLSREGAERQAAKRQQETGEAFAVVPHPTVKGRFAVEAVSVPQAAESQASAGQANAAMPLRTAISQSARQSPLREQLPQSAQLANGNIPSERGNNQFSSGRQSPDQSRADAPNRAQDNSSLGTSTANDSAQQPTNALLNSGEIGTQGESARGIEAPEAFTATPQRGTAQQAEVTNAQSPLDNAGQGAAVAPQGGQGAAMAAQGEAAQGAAVSQATAQGAQTQPEVTRAAQLEPTAPQTGQASRPQGAPQGGAQESGSGVEELRRQLRAVEDKILLAAPPKFGNGQLGGDIEGAMRSLKVPKALKEQRKALKEQIRAAQQPRSDLDTVAERVTEPTHADPGQAPEAATAPVIREAIQKSARNTPFNAKEAKAWLLAEIDRAIANVPPANRDMATDLAQEKARKFKLSDRVAKLGKGSMRDKLEKSERDEFEAMQADRIAKTARQIGFVTFDVPGDGKFKVVNTVEAIEAFRDKAEASPGFRANPVVKPNFGTGTAQGPSLDETLKKLGNTPDALQEIGNAIEIARLKKAKDEDKLLDRFREASNGKDYDAWRAEQEAAGEIAAREAAQPAPAEPAQPRAEQGERADREADTQERAELSDFGQKLGGARKDRTPAMRAELTDEDIANQPLSKIWPTSEIGGIEDTFVAAFAHAARAEIPSKPRKGYKLAGWVSKVKILRDLTRKVLDGRIAREHFAGKLREFAGLENFRAKVALLETLPREQWGRIGGVGEHPDAYRFDNGEKVASPYVRVEIDGNTKIYAGNRSVSEVVDKVASELDGEQAAKKMQFEVRGSGSSYFINKKGDREYRKLKTFTDPKEALAYVKSNYDDLVAAWEGVKDRDNVTKADVRNETNRPRTGADHRKGKDVAPEQFSEQFGFRGVEFGNWVNQGKDARERQGMLNQAYDALMDLASILGVPPKAISLNGSLGLGFGSRGAGGASAHFEPDTLVINLTKTRGAGTLAHEWFHALDNYFARSRRGEVKIQRGLNAQQTYREQNFITYRPEPGFVHKTQTSRTMTKGELERYRKQNPSSGYFAPENWKPDPSHPEGVRPEVEQAFAELVNALNASPMAARSRMLDKSPDGYWSRIIERGARSFENYVIAKMMEQGYSNDYLANVRQVETFARSADRYPYLLDSEIQPVKEAFDALFGTIQTRETDKGVALFSRDTATEGTTESAIRSAIASLIGPLRTKRVIVAQSADELVAQGILTAEQANGAQAFVKDGKAYFIAGNIQPGNERAVFLHEVGAHLGMEKILSPFARKVLLTKIRNWSQESGTLESRIAKAAQRRVEAAGEAGNDSETLAYFVEEAVKAGIDPTVESTSAIGQWFRSFMASVRTALEKLGLINPKQLTAQDIVDMARGAAGVALEQEGTGAAQFSRADQIDSPAFKRWFAGSKVVDADGKPLVVYHGTDKDIKSFKPGRGSKAIWFAADSSLANEFVAGGRRNMTGGAKKGSAIYPVYLAMRKPLDLGDASPQDFAAYWYPLEVAGLPADFAAVSEIARRSIEMGYAGVSSTIANPVEYLAKSFMSGRNRLSDVLDNPALIEMLQEAGFDGIKMNEQSTVIFAAFSPDQIKSAIGNNGNFDPNDARIQFSRAASTIAPVWDVPESSKLFGRFDADSLLYTLQDKHIDTKRVVEAIRKQSGDIADEFNPYLQEELFHGRSAKGVKDFLDGELRPLLSEMSIRKVGMEELEKYLHARHAEERNIQIAKINPKMPDGGSGMTTQDAQDYLAQIDPARKALLDKLAAKIDAMNAATRDVLVQSGLEKPETIKAWEGAYKHYVPLQREEVESHGLGIGQGFSVKGSASKRAMGSDKPVADIIANIAMQRERAIVRAEKNRVAQAYYGLSLKAPNPDFWMTINPAEAKAFTPKQQQTVIDELTSLGLDPADALNFVKEPTQRYIDPRTGLVAERINPVMRSAPNVLAVRINGEDRYVFFNAGDERASRMVHALKNLDADQLGRLLQTSAKITRYFSSINTQWNPVFGVVNLTRDVQGALLNLSTTPLRGSEGRVLADTFSALKGIYSDLRAIRKGGAATSQWASLWEEFQKEGGQTGYRDMFANATERAEAIEREMKKLTEGNAKAGVRAVFDWLSDYNESMENAVRLATYKAAIDQGISKQRAASIAKSITVNFNRKGAVAVQAGAIWAFFNASAQGSFRMIQTLRGPSGRKIILGGLTLGAVQALALAAAGFDDEEPPEFVRERSIIIPTGGGKYVAIPMPLGFHVIPNLSRITTEWALSGFKHTPDRISGLLGLFADTFNPIGGAGLSMQTLAPTALDPLAALAENKDWSGKPIAREDMSSMDPSPGYLRAKDTASALSKAVAYWANLATGGTDYKPGFVSPTPDQLDYLIGQIAGGVGREYMKLEQTATSALTGEDLPPHKVPLLGRFYGDTTGQSSEANRFYANVREINLHKSEIDGRRKNGGDVMEYLNDNPTARLAMGVSLIETTVRKLRQARRDALERGDSADRIKAIDGQITAVMSQFNQRFAELDK